MRTKTFIFICILLSTSIVYSQRVNRFENYVDRRDSIVSKIGRTPDLLYWKGDRYLLNRSFLSVLKGYKDIYTDITGYGHMFIEPGTMGLPINDKYFAWWLLKEDILYLRVLDFFGANNGYYDVDPKRYKVMEQFTKGKFLKSKDPEFAKLEPKESVVGSMKASWVNGTFYIKKAKAFKGEDIEDWYDAPYHKVTFKKGKLISDEIHKPKNKPRKSSDEKKN